MKSLKTIQRKTIAKMHAIDMPHIVKFSKVSQTAGF
jgi:hypothetical protein